MTDDGDFSVEKDCIFFAHCYCSHKSFADKKNRKYVIAFSEKLSQELTQLFEKSTLPTILTDKEFNRGIRQYFEKLVTEAEVLPSIMIKGYLYLILGSLLSNYEKVKIKPKNKNISDIVEILNYVDSHCDENITLASVAAYFGYNKSYFSRRFNSYVGVNFSDYVNGIRLDRYERLRKKEEGKGVTELAFLAGFQSLPTF